jgi:hypothetical protein
MNRKQQSVVLAGMLALALAGCGTMRGKMSDDGSGATGSGTSSGGSGSSSMGSGSSTGSGGTSGAGGTGGGSGSGTTTGTGTTGSTSTMGTEGGAGGMAGTASGSAAGQSQQTPSTGSSSAGTMAPNAMVMAIEAVPKSGTGAVGGSGGTGTTGSSSMGEDRMYRVTLRMDDGTTLVVTQATPPTYRMGDRVNMSDGAISH